MTTSQYIERQASLCATTPLLVGFAGYAGSGKDTAAAALTPEATGRQWVTVRISDPIWDALLAVDPEVTDDFNLTDDFALLSDRIATFGREVMKREFKQVRGALEALGRWGRSVDVDLWVNAAMAKVTEALLEGKSVIVPDIRINSEVAALLGAGDRLTTEPPVLAFVVQRPGVEPITGGAEDNDWLRAGAPGCTTLLNDSTPQALQAKVLAALGDYVVAR